MVEEDPFARLEAKLAAPKSEGPTPSSEPELVARTKERFSALFAAIERYSSLLAPKGGSVTYEWRPADVSNGIAKGQLSVRFRDRAALILMVFQGQAVWFEDKDFQLVTERTNEHGSWRTSEMTDLINKVGKYLEHLVEKFS